VICGDKTIPTRFPLPYWRAAIEAAGGIAVADALIRAARQECSNQPWHGNDASCQCAAELGEVARVLSERLI
jgi:hypothetical protein